MDSNKENIQCFVDDNGYWGYKSDDEIVIPAKYHSALPFNNGIAWVKSLYWGAIDLNGNIIVPFRFRYVEQIDENIYSVCSFEHKLGLYDVQGCCVIKPEYYSVSRVCDAIFELQKDSKKYLATYEGELLCGGQEIDSYLEIDNVVRATTCSNKSYIIDKSGDLFPIDSNMDLLSASSQFEVLWNHRETYQVLDRQGDIQESITNDKFELISIWSQYLVIKKERWDCNSDFVLKNIVTSNVDIQLEGVDFIKYDDKYAIVTYESGGCVVIKKEVSGNTPYIYSRPESVDCKTDFLINKRKAIIDAKGNINKLQLALVDGEDNVYCYMTYGSLQFCDSNGKRIYNYLSNYNEQVHIAYYDTTINRYFFSKEDKIKDLKYEMFIIDYNGNILFRRYNTNTIERISDGLILINNDVSKYAGKVNEVKRFCGDFYSRFESIIVSTKGVYNYQTSLGNKFHITGNAIIDNYGNELLSFNIAYIRKVAQNKYRVYCLQEGEDFKVKLCTWDSHSLCKSECQVELSRLSEIQLYYFADVNHLALLDIERSHYNSCNQKRLIFIDESNMNVLCEDYIGEGSVYKIFHDSILLKYRDSGLERFSLISSSGDLKGSSNNRQLIFLGENRYDWSELPLENGDSRKMGVFDIETESIIVPQNYKDCTYLSINQEDYFIVEDFSGKLGLYHHNNMVLKTEYVEISQIILNPNDREEYDYEEEYSNYLVFSNQDGQGVVWKDSVLVAPEYAFVNVIKGGYSDTWFGDKDYIALTTNKGISYLYKQSQLLGQFHCDKIVYVGRSEDTKWFKLFDGEKEGMFCENGYFIEINNYKIQFFEGWDTIKYGIVGDKLYEGTSGKTFIETDSVFLAMRKVNGGYFAFWNSVENSYIFYNSNKEVMKYHTVDNNELGKIILLDENEHIVFSCEKKEFVKSPFKHDDDKEDIEHITEDRNYYDDEIDYDEQTYYALGGTDYEKFKENGGDLDEYIDGLGF